MKIPTIEELRLLSPQFAEKRPYLKMLVLFGSRATGKIHAESDWDFAALYDEEVRKAYIKDNAWAWFEVPQLLSDFFEINSDKIDVVELNNCSWLIAHFVARDGVLLYEKDPGGFEYFRLTALRSESELKKFRQDQRQLIDMELKEWGV
ncbi:nucleotidyltransferase domain-containing protein [Funiculus sociatus GB2-A5]|uniref:Nucleotidyltransferase domain-containing protein n=1 Tax=Funiculus sociatus GB2-A5 TaxID=2933946 RepID=A0ABV0JTV0_9CYAN|nr:MULTISPECIES: nucleotidyltransferase domain-containing protein [unclassified Trichocoleus]MBD1906744.1 nucleotidyltransferase domain-containing protein [Trichocoleus sp. FACHB-832]MBD2061477.1 nucleotidyltransferase domain-containing protein [Trichocoleus sp. FACHB-6]